MYCRLNASIKSDRKMLVALEEQNRLLEMERQNWLKKYRAAEKKYTHEFEEYRNELIEKNPDYNRLIEKKIEEKKLRINLMWLQQNTEQNKLIQKQSAAIQKKLFYADIIEFAKANVEYVKSKKLHEKITEMEATEKGLLEKLSRLHIAKGKYAGSLTIIPLYLKRNTVSEICIKILYILLVCYYKSPSAVFLPY